MHTTKLRLPLARMATVTKQLKPTRLYETLFEGVRLLREARSIKDTDMQRDADTIRRSLCVKFTAALAISEFTSTYLCSPIVGMSVQYSTNSPYYGIGATIIGDYLSALISFHVTWAALNADYYTKSAPSFLRKAKIFTKDVFSFVKINASAALPVYVVGATLSALAITTVNFFSTTLAYNLPLPILTWAIDAVICQAIFLSLLINPSLELLSKIGAAYVSYLETHHNKSPKVSTDATVPGTTDVN